ncbi:MAG: GYD domain-containing protein, partial [Actinobacteria bacterium]|nr:GYD domain-containing protein [Actinomycetota bacterium]
MPTYVMLTTLGPDGWATVREHPERIAEVTTEVEKMGLKVVAQYGLMGQYDFLNVIEAPDEQTMARAAIT